jgi:hypothetical protein
MKPAFVLRFPARTQSPKTLADILGKPARIQKPNATND